MCECRLPTLCNHTAQPTQGFDEYMNLVLDEAEEVSGEPAQQAGAGNNGRWAALSCVALSCRAAPSRS